MTTTLIVTVDTEEDDAWNSGYVRGGQTVENIRNVGSFQDLCARFGIRPTYLVDTPVADDPRCVELLRRIQDSGGCEIGAHLHPWCTPPFTEDLSPRNSFLCNLSAELQREKIRSITEAINNRFGRRPTSFRAGRYGLDIVGFKILRELEYRTDSSVIPFSDYSSEDGPDFRSAPCIPYQPNENRLDRTGGKADLLEIPLSVGFSRPNFDRADKVRQSASTSWLRNVHAVGVLDRLGIVRRIKFSPEQSDAHRMRQLIDASLQRGAPTLVMSLHSSSLCVGCSPYTRTTADLERLYRNLETTFEYCRKTRDMSAATLTEFANHWRDNAS